MTCGSFSDRRHLVNGVSIPGLGFGTYKHGVTSATTVEMIRHAAQIGYRLFDTASLYANERSIGAGLRRSGVPREELFVVSKVWNQDQGYESTLAVIEESLADLRMEYIDLYLVHWPIPADHDHDWKDLNLATWRAMEKCYREGKLRAIGVSNFLEHHLQPLMAAAEIPVMVNEMEMNVGYYQREIHRFCLEQGIQIVAYSPLKGIDRGYPALEQLAQKYSRTPAQIALRWLIQRGMNPIPRSYDRERIKENTEVFDFNLTPAELELLCSIQDADRHHQHPDSARIRIDRYAKQKI